MTEESFYNTDKAGKTRLAASKRSPRYVVDIFRKECVYISWVVEDLLKGLPTHLRGYVSSFVREDRDGH